MSAVVEETLPAGAAASSSDDNESSSCDEPDVLTGGSGVVTAGVRSPKPVGLGLDHLHAILRSPNSKDPVIIRRSDVGGLNDTEDVLTGGMLEAPVMLPETVTITGRRFFPLQRLNSVMSVFLTGKHQRDSPLKGIPIFHMMKSRLTAHYNVLLAEAEKTLADAGLTTDTKKKRLSQRRSHHGGGTAAALMLPQYDQIDMSVGTVTWKPTVVVRNRPHENALMEVKAENFQALFTIVQAQLSDPDTIREIIAIPKKKRARPSDHEHAVINSPRGNRYYVAGKGLLQCRTEVASGSGSSARTRRRFTVIASSSRAANKLAKPVRGKKRKSPEDVLGKDGDDAMSCKSRAASESEEP